MEKQLWNCGSIYTLTYVITCGSAYGLAYVITCGSAYGFAYVITCIGPSVDLTVVLPVELPGTHNRCKEAAAHHWVIH